MNISYEDFEKKVVDYVIQRFIPKLKNPNHKFMMGFFMPIMVDKGRHMIAEAKPDGFIVNEDKSINLDNLEACLSSGFDVSSFGMNGITVDKSDLEDLVKYMKGE